MLDEGTVGAAAAAAAADDDDEDDEDDSGLSPSFKGDCGRNESISPSKTDSRVVSRS